MAAPERAAAEARNGIGDGGAAYRPALALLATLFFMSGFITVINDTLLHVCAACSTTVSCGIALLQVAANPYVAVIGYGLQLSFLLPAACELYVLFCALWGAAPTRGAAPAR